ncbi:MAG: hypothetical protein ABIN54_07390 [candidate division WOR-3 bacterium]
MKIEVSLKDKEAVIRMDEESLVLIVSFLMALRVATNKEEDLLRINEELMRICEGNEEYAHAAVDEFNRFQESLSNLLSAFYPEAEA